MTITKPENPAFGAVSEFYCFMCRDWFFEIFQAGNTLTKDGAPLGFGGRH